MIRSEGNAGIQPRVLLQTDSLFMYFRSINGLFSLTLTYPFYFFFFFFGSILLSVGLWQADHADEGSPTDLSYEP